MILGLACKVWVKDRRLAARIRGISWVPSILTRSVLGLLTVADIVVQVVVGAKKLGNKNVGASESDGPQWP